MRIAVLALILMCLAAETSARDGTIWLGPEVSFPVPARDLGDDQLGIDAGMTLTVMRNTYVGTGVDLVHHYWPASPGYRAAFDRYLRRTRFQTIESTTWAFTALQLTVHVKLVAPVSDHYSPWVQVGAGLYRLDRNLGPPNWENSSTRVLYHPGDIAMVPGGYARVGFDVRTGSRWTAGFMATFHYIGSEHEDIPDFSALNAGTRLQFGW